MVCDCVMLLPNIIFSETLEVAHRAFIQTILEQPWHCCCALCHLLQVFWSHSAVIHPCTFSNWCLSIAKHYNSHYNEMIVCDYILCFLGFLLMLDVGRWLKTCLNRLILLSLENANAFPYILKTGCEQIRFYYKVAFINWAFTAWDKLTVFPYWTSHIPLIRVSTLFSCFHSSLSFVTSKRETCKTVICNTFYCTLLCI